jgi:hypothetical protein
VRVIRPVPLGALLALAGVLTLGAVSAAAAIPAGPDPYGYDPASGTGGITYNPEPASGGTGALHPPGKVVTVTLDSCGSDNPWYDPLAQASCLSGNVGKFVYGAGQFLGNPLGAMLQFMSDNLLVDPCPGGGTCPAGAQHPGFTIGSILAGRPPFFNHDPGEWGTDNMYTRLWSVSLSVAGVLIALAAGMRVIRMSFDHKRLGAVLPETAPRVIAGFACAWLSYKVLAWLAYVASDLGRLALRAFFLNTAAGQDAGGVLAGQLAGAAAPAGPPILTLLPLLVALFVLLWVLALMVVRFIVLTFCIVLAPVAVAVAVYDGGNDFVQWWAKMLAGAIVAPLVAGTILGVTFSLSFNLSVDGGVFGQVTSEVILLGGLVFLARALQALTFGAVRTGNVAGVVAAAETGLLVGSRVKSLGGGLARAARPGQGESGGKAAAIAPVPVLPPGPGRGEPVSLDPGWLTSPADHDAPVALAATA